MSSKALPYACRALALAIVVAGVIDPAITSDRRTRPLLSVVTQDSARDQATLNDLTRQLGARYTLIRAPLPAAAGTVLIGDRVPSATPLASPVIVVSPSARTARLVMHNVRAPSSAALESRAPIAATFDISGVSSKQTLTLQLLHQSRIVADTQLVVARDASIQSSLSFVPTSAEPSVVQLRAFIKGMRDTVRHDVLIDVRTSRRNVLFFDRRPSWMSTFVRRAIERDPRFAVTSRIITSANATTVVSRETGRAPLGLDAIASTESFDAVIIGAPDALTARDVDGVRTLLRTRGVSVLLLADHAAAGPIDALVGAGGWRSIARRTPAGITNAATNTAESLSLKATAIGLPGQLPRDVETLAVLRDSVATRESGQPVIWRSTVGLGQLVVSGAFDAWRFRDSAQSTFDATWRDLVDQAASARQRPLDLQLSASLVTPRSAVSLIATTREAARAASMAALLTRSDSASQAQPAAQPEAIALATGETVDQRLASIDAPLAPGAYEVTLVQGPDSVRAPLVVRPNVAHDGDAAPELLSAWATSRGGSTLAREDLARLPSVLDSLVQPVARATTWHPMRSPWWIVPLALALATEWWTRRRRGLA